MKKLLLALGLALALVFAGGYTQAHFCQWNHWTIVDPEIEEDCFITHEYLGDDGDEETWTACTPEPEEDVCEVDMIVKYEDKCDITYFHISTEDWDDPLDCCGPNITKTQCEKDDDDSDHCPQSCGGHGYCKEGEVGCTHSEPTWDHGSCKCTCYCEDGETTTTPSDCP
jgi:hypothetical protein